jgi:hypothetical protein
MDTIPYFDPDRFYLYIRAVDSTQFAKKEGLVVGFFWQNVIVRAFL